MSIPDFSPVSENGTGVAVFGGGCFWCTEAIFDLVNGVLSVEPGYAGGTVPGPSYEEVCSGNTGHAEVVRITFDTAIISYADLLDLFLHTHDPTTPNRQGADTGTQYRSIILTTGKEQEVLAKETIRSLDASGEFPGPIVTEITPLSMFYPAENYHTDYYINNRNSPYCSMVIAPKVKKFLQQYGKKKHFLR